MEKEIGTRNSEVKPPKDSRKARWKESPVTRRERERRIAHYLRSYVQAK